MNTGVVVVAGAGMAAVSLAEALRTGGYPHSITLLGAEPGLPYDRPPLSKDLLRGARDPDDTTLHPQQWYAERGISLRSGRAVTDINADGATARLDDGTSIGGDVLVLATGGIARVLTPRVLTVDSGHPALHTLRTATDARRLRAALTPGVRLVVIGAGLIGAEVTASAVERGATVTLIDPGDLPLARAAGDEAAAKLHQRHAQAGVTVLQAHVEQLQPGTGRTLLVRLARDQVVEADVVLVGVGMLPACGLAEAAGLDVDDGVLVDDQYLTSHPRVYAIGDIARRRGPDGPQPRIEHWDNALRSAHIAAAAIAGIEPPPVRAPWFWSDRYDQHLETVGHPTPDAMLIRRSTADSEYVGLYLVDGRCTSAVTINRPLDARAAQRLIDERVPITAEQAADPSLTLRDVLKEARTVHNGH